MAAVLHDVDNERKRKAAACLGVLLLCEEDECRAKRGKTRNWIKRRSEKGFFQNIVQELRIEDIQGYREMMRMAHEQFIEILTAIEPFITKRQVIGGHKVISPAERLTLTLRFLATGETFRSLSFQFRISRSTISYIVREVCQAIFKVLGEKHLKTPATPEEWLDVSVKFEDKWQFPNCIGAVDGKHLVLQPPPGSGSHFFNYKKTHSIVLMAVAGPDYECLYADVGTNGRVSDGGVWNKCSLLQSLADETLSVPPPRPLPFGRTEMPFVLVGDDAFALKSFLMKPYPQKQLSLDRRIYNYRYSMLP